ncbi:IclR family transcriptional regulator [Actinoallomurus rhizosphaericola]|uniref:IclR family transcriptional regulator n=1 Tax=Actinoallomurus rhizosphaericola TaxID=2952536 RepID=UPI0020900A70|nr:IclR family transcriptional regulator [Actinoallomurus rhizosphaericola]MCO5994107.1 IclR family transcriptional regulator [Actinoallomurus rhizosphaericola]
MVATQTGGGSIDKALTVLEALAEHSRVTDIAAGTGLPKSTVHRILQSLVGWGFARTDGRGGYLPGPRILTLAGKVMSRFDPAQHADSALQALRDRTGFTVHFAIRSGDEAVYVRKLEGLRPYRMGSRVGMSLRLHSTSIGKAILAQLSDDEVTAIASRTGLEPRTERTITEVDALIAHLAEVRRHGHAVDDEENERGIRCVGAPVFDHTGAVMGGISVSGLAFEVGVDDAPLFAAVMAAARDVSLAMGAPPERVPAPTPA